LTIAQGQLCRALRLVLRSQAYQTFLPAKEKISCFPIQVFYIFE
jgi:hypothetical protein